MPEIMTVTAVAPTGSSFDFVFTGMSNYYAVGNWDDPAMGDALHLQYKIESMEDGSFTKELLAQWLQFNAAGRSSIPTILARFAAMETLRYTTMNLAYYQIQEAHQWESTTPGNNATGLAFAPFLGMWHFLNGNGSTVTIDLNQIGLSFNAANLTPVATALANNAPGNYSIAADFGKSVAEDNLYIASFLGRISMKTEGQLQINESGSWTYDGVVRAYNDTYDANFDPSRGVIAQASTTVLSWFNGKPYPVAMPGEIKVSLSGQR